MDWLKDKKNLPFVIGGAAVLIIGSILFMLYSTGTFTPSNPTPPPVSQVAAPVMSAPPAPPGAASMAAGRQRHIPRHIMPSGQSLSPQLSPPGAEPSVTTASAQTATGSGTAATTVSPINPATAPDPFAVSLAANPLDLHTLRKKIAASLPSLLTVLPPDNIYTGVSAESQLPAVDKPHPMTMNGLEGNAPYQIAELPRVSGILYDDGIFAIIQPANGPSESVKPGDDIRGVGKVESIQSDGVTVKTPEGSTLQIPVSSGPPENNGYPGGGYPGGPPPMGYPGGGNPGGPPPMGYPGEGNPGGPPPMGNNGP